MYYFILLLFIFSFSKTIYAQDTASLNLSDPISETATHNIYGSEMDLDLADKSISLDTAILNPIDNSEVFIKTSIGKMCKKNGCFFIANDGEFSARVTFKDYSFFIPTNSSGKEVILRGILNEKILPVEQAKHYAEDLGEDSDTIAYEQKEYTIVATSVMIRKD